MPGSDVAQRVPESLFFIGMKRAGGADLLRFTLRTFDDGFVTGEQQGQYKAFQIQLGRQDGVQNIHGGRIEKATDSGIAGCHGRFQIVEAEQDSP